MVNILGFMGLIPFVSIPIMIWILQDQGSLSGYDITNTKTHLLYLFTLYSGGIALFMAGAIWGRTVNTNPTKALPLVASNIIALFVIALGLLLVDSIWFVIVGLMLAHGLNWVFEPRQLHPNAERHYVSLRSVLTSIVTLCHVWIYCLF
ncbi:hypothetical protein VII00023_06397 [Vibrio ichthyoenteri ATCC 700023]|uniref:DUF3429 domain-containing protein n=1 Tax=Vibrio ichthyoenteri ATCC 700023 TaxID=870968 RepID=F9S1S1_9VIBR|nr:DUF3429 domain-containing protein [Vibrio ichthyoenteri]EGU41463.1 hypothetical protein VII00023_06397 [Vibrio ichthyoenteri ATCC 700023]